MIIPNPDYADSVKIRIVMRCYGNPTILLSERYQHMPQIIGIRICRPLNNDKRKKKPTKNTPQIHRARVEYSRNEKTQSEPVFDFSDGVWLFTPSRKNYDS